MRPLTRRASVSRGTHLKPFARDNPITRHADSVRTQCNAFERRLDIAAALRVKSDFRKTDLREGIGKGLVRSIVSFAHNLSVALDVGSQV
jgi:hypothetical protein